MKNLPTSLILDVFPHSRQSDHDSVPEGALRLCGSSRGTDFSRASLSTTQGFGRYAGYGPSAPSIQSETRSRLLGHDRSKLQYKDLMPGALAILEGSSRVRQLVADRWGLVICDEAQDTDTEQWRLLQMLASRKVLLLGDPNQMIYTFIKGVSRERFQEMEGWADREIQLDPRSHLDPSGAIPALAEAVRQRRFNDEAVLEALRTSRLEIHFDVADDERLDLLSAAVTDAEVRKFRDVGIFVHSKHRWRRNLNLGTCLKPTAIFETKAAPNSAPFYRRLVIRAQPPRNCPQFEFRFKES